MKLRSDPWLLVGLILSILLSAWHTYMDWREDPGRVPPSVVPESGILEQPE